LKLSNLIIFFLSQFASFIIELPGFFFQDSLKFSDGSFINQTFLSFSLNFICQLNDFTLKRSISLFVIRDDSKFFGQYVFEFFDSRLISLTFSSFLVNLIPEELNLLVIFVTFFVVLLHFSVLLIGIFDSFIENGLQFPNFSFVNHAFSPFIFNDVSELLDFVIVSFTDLGMFFDMPGFLCEDAFEFSDCGFIG
jgi:hypothetical protein